MLTVCIQSLIIACSMLSCHRGELHDTILDWEDALPNEELKQSESNCKKADLCLCLGTSLQIMPCGNFPMLTKKNNGKIVVVNLQETRMSKHADLIIKYKLDDVFRILFDMLKFESDLDARKSLEIKIQSDYTLDAKRHLLLDTSHVDFLFPAASPVVVLIMSGKRKSGKDYTCKKLAQLLVDKFNVQTITIAAPMKQEYARINNLDYNRLLGSCGYKETFRLDMIRYRVGLKSHALIKAAGNYSTF